MSSRGRHKRDALNRRFSYPRSPSHQSCSQAHTRNPIQVSHPVYTTTIHLSRMGPIPLSFAYKYKHGLPIHLDVFPPVLRQETNSKSGLESERGDQVPAVVFFHGGGLTVGNRTNWFPTWLKGIGFFIIDETLTSEHPMHRSHRFLGICIHRGRLPAHSTIFRTRHC